jgi:hypothetical protein
MATKMQSKPESKPAKCDHQGYAIKDGELRCVQCGQLSPKARLVNGNLVPIKPRVTCPECGHEFETT